MDLVMVSSVLGALRDSAEMLLLGGSESLSLALWGSGLLAIAAWVKGSLAATHRFHVRERQAHLSYISEHRSLKESRA